MRLADHFASTSFRIATAYALLFAASVIVLFGVFYGLTTNEMNLQVRAEVEQEVHLLEDTYREGGLARLTETIRDRTRRIGRNPNIYILRDARGVILAGNERTVDPFIGWQELAIGRAPGRPVVLENGQPFLVRGVALAKGTLVVGASLHRIEEVQEALLRALTWALGLTIFLALAGGVVMGRGALRRVEAINRTTHDIVQGNLSMRVPVAGTCDEIDGLAVNINRMLDRIEELMGNLRQVTNDIAHDLRTPLGRLRQRLEAARSRDGHAAEDEDVLDAAIEETDAILQTFGALLSIAEIEAGARKQRFAAISLSDTVRNLVEVYETVAEDNGQTLQAKIQTEMTCRGDRDLLTQMLANLVENAIRHTPAGTRIVVTLSQEPSGSLLAVADDGPGIPPEDKDKVFHRFYRSEQSRTTPGTGLGLALVKAVIDLHDGTVAVLDNAPGLRVEIRFPNCAVLARASNELK